MICSKLKLDIRVKFFLDQSPRRLYYFLRTKINKRESIQEFNDEFPCVFVLSTGRVGTETLAALFDLADNVFSYHEPAPILYELSKLSYRHSAEPLACEILQEAFLTSRRDLLKYSLECQRGYVETSPQVTFLAPVILGAIPNARFIHIVRDPRSVVRSGMRRKWFAGHLNDKYRITPADSAHAENWASYTSFQKNLWLWSETNRWILQFLANVNPERKLFVRSEDIFSGNKDLVKELFDFINAPMPPTRRVGKILQQQLNSQREGSFPVSVDWTPEMNQQLFLIAGKEMADLGYN